ncbi:MAG TPA: hypothetical protein VGR84_19250 [Candidatus Acidoferrales bacterium]|nr:hypothetical protein [Candidatus Acidoferrales bacterium]
MASTSKIVISVQAARGSTRVSYSTKGRYVSFITNGYQRQLLQQSLQPTSSLSAYWQSVIGLVLADIEANP